MKKIYFLLISLCLFTSVNAQIINFPDANFKAKLLEASPSNNISQNLSVVNFKIDANNNGEIEVSEAEQVSALQIPYSSIISLDGISNFSNLTYLDCSQNQLSTLNLSNNSLLTDLQCYYNQLTSLNVSGNTSLENLNCYNNQLIYLSVSNNSLLKYLQCLNNQLTNLDLSNNTALIFLSCDQNQLYGLNLTNNTSLITLYCRNNQLTSLNLGNNTIVNTVKCDFNQLTSLNVNNNISLLELNCSNNQLTNLDFSNNRYLYALECSSNQLTSLDLSNNKELSFLNCNFNQLNNLFIKNGLNEIWQDSNGNFTSVFLFENNLNLQYICADENQISQIQNQISVYGYTNCHVNSYCSFTPGGTFYTFQGNNKYDSNNNSCDALDLPLSNLKFNITDGTNSVSLISNTSGSYSIPVQAGTHTITPVFENPSYFAVSPTTVNVTFPTQTSPFTQNFCITANGVHPDLEVTLLPLEIARPGFDATYKIIYKNKGNTTQSGTVNLVFNDAVLDLVLANPTTTSQTANNLSWDFVNLAPFETREITVILNVNSPMETPAVNSGDVLNYTATITSPATDDLPNDNTFEYNQTVVNSFDPNDKTCLEGATITPTKVGDYVHYMIRFENNGTANAQNIVVKDMIDLAKFDINSIVPIKGSHSFVTNIKAGNKVEFICQNINLPFANATNDGYVSFKIKTKPTLVLGNTFSNSASIYFDYNFPIVTNTATTTIAVLSRQDFVFSNYFSVYPNPVSDVLNITSKESISVSSINIYNTLGQLVLVIPNAQNTKTVDVSSLTSGNYFIKINSDKGTSNTKFVKN